MAYRRGARVGSKEPTRRLSRPHMTDYITPTILPRFSPLEL